MEIYSLKKIERYKAKEKSIKGKKRNFEKMFNRLYTIKI